MIFYIFVSNLIIFIIMNNDMKTQIIINNTKFISIILCCLFFTVLFSSISFAQDEIIKVDTDLVTVPVTVFDRDGRYVTNLEKENFTILEDGNEQEIEYFGSSSKQLTVFLLFDRSGSMASQLYEIANAANIFVSQLNQEDQIIAASFADDVDLIVKLTKLNNLKKGIKIRSYKDDHYTRLYDGVEYSLKKMKYISGRKAIIVFSDGFGDGLFGSSKENIRDAQEGESIIYTIQYQSTISPRKNLNEKKYYERTKEADTYMKQLAEVTGGRSYRIEEIIDLSNIFAQVANELGQQYSIGYYPKTQGKKGERRQIKVKVNVPNVAVRARESYIVGSNND